MAQKKRVKKATTKKVAKKSKKVETKKPKQKIRNKGLTIWLSIVFIVNILVGISYFVSDFSSAYPNAEPYIFTLFGLVSFFNAYLIYLIFKWKKIGFYVITGIALFAFAINLGSGASILESAIGLLGPLILYLFMRPQWDLFE